MIDEMRVITVSGPVRPESLGYVDAHSHLWIEPVSGADPAAPRLNDEKIILEGLLEYTLNGGGAIVDCQPGGCGRNGNKLAQLSEQSGVGIIACTGFHRRRYYGPDAPLFSMSAERAYQHFTGEFRDGLVETRKSTRKVYPGFIKIAAERSLAASPRPLFEAAAYTSRETGMAIEVHTERGSDVETILDFFTGHGLPAGRLVFCHVDKRPDLGLHRALAEAGVMLEYDTFFRPKYDPVNNAWPLVEGMIAGGLGRYLSLATDMAEKAMWQGTGPSAFITTMKSKLERMGIPNQIIELVLGGNITGRLAITL
jgi:phosphotriesterase-related protein